MSGGDDRVIREATDADWPAIWPIFREIVAEGETYAYPEDLDAEAGRRLWMLTPPSLVVVLEDDGELLGSATMGPNRPGRGDHVGTASFMVSSRARGRGVGRALGEHVVQWHREHGFAAIQFNAVVESNLAAVRLWRSLGFRVVGTVPGAFRSRSHGYVGLHVMHLPLTEPGTRHTATAELLGEVYGLVTGVAEGLAPHEVEIPTRAAGWSVRDLILHMLLDTQRALIALASPAETEPDVDEVSYWRSFRPGDDEDARDAHAGFVRSAAAAYTGTAGLFAQWSATWQAAVRAVEGSAPTQPVHTQGHVITVAALVDTLLVEATVHYLDVTVGLKAPPAPEQALAHTRAVVAALYGEPLPTVLDDVTAVLVGTGRLPVDRALFGTGADRLPVLG